MADLVVEQFDVPYEGLNTDVDGFRLPPRQSPYIKNFLVHRDGVLPVRGPIRTHAEMVIDAAANSVLTGAWTFNDTVLVGRQTLSASAVRTPWQAPYRRVANEADLAGSNSTMRVFDLSANTVADLAAGANDRVICGRGARIGSNVYGFAFNGLAGASQTINGGRQWNRPFLRWDGSAAPAEYTNGPQSGQDIIAHLNRLFVAGGIPAGGTVIEPNVLYFSDQIASSGAALADAATSWQDDATGLVNRIVIGDDDQNDFCVGLARLGQNLVVFKRRSIYVLYGYSPSTFTVRRVVSNRGCVDRRSIVERDEAVYFMSEDGYCRFDGTDATLVSPNLHSVIEHEVGGSVGENSHDAGYATACEFPDGYIMVSCGVQNTANGAMTSSASFNPHSYLFHAPTDRWTVFGTDALDESGDGIDGPVLAVRAATQWVGFNVKRAIKLTGITRPEATPDGEKGRDIYVRGGNTTRTVPGATLLTRTLRLASPGRRAQLHRLVFDHTTVLSVNNSDFDAWTVEVRRGSIYETTTLETITIPNNNVGGIPVFGQAPMVGHRVSDVRDVFYETDAVNLLVTQVQDSDMDNRDIRRAEIYDMAIEYQTTRQRRLS
jgi:hypothetical protein